jgi:flagellar biosynthesis GTPase FlhF
MPPTPQHLFKQLSKDRQQNADVLEKQSMRGVKLRVIEKYSDSAHFIYELLQNADDVKATRARFVLTESGILFAHNGTIHFSVTAHDNEEIDTQNQRLGHINAITSIGNSNKYEAQIGKFGVGFKAVFQYSNTPEIYDPPFFFRIERFIVPILLSSDHPDRQPDETLFYFPFDNPLQSPALAFQVILKKLKNLINPLLFLRYLTEINWVASDGNQGKYIKNDKANFSQKLVFFQTTTQENNKSYTQNFLIFTNKTNTHSFSIAYLTHLSEKGEPLSISSQQTFPAYCFFPTKETTHLHFIVQAPFLLTDNREGIKQNEEWNRHLIEALAQLTADSLPIIKEIGLLTDDFFNVLPINEADFPAEHLFRPIYEAVLKRLQSDNALLPNQAGGYTPQKKAYLAENPALMHLLTSEQLSVLVKNEGAQWVFSQTTHHQRLLWDYVKHHLVNQELTSDKLVRRLTKAFIQMQSDEWLIQFYTYLLEKARYLWKYKHNTLQTKPLLRLTHNEIVSPYNRVGKIQVYLPTENESEYPTVKRCFIENEKSLQFLLALGLDKPKAFEEIKYYIFPRYKDDNAPPVMLRDFKKLFSYFLNCPWHQKEDYLNQLKNMPYACHLADNSSARFLPSAIYFNTESLKNFFRHTPDIYFLDNAFYANMAEEKTQFIHFFNALGVEDKPRRIKIKAILSGQEREAIHQGKYTYDYYHSSQYTYDYDIEGLDAFLTEMNLERSKILWHFLLKLIEDNLGQEIFKGQYNWFYRRERYHYFDAKFLITLRQTAWLYTNNNCIKPADIIAPELAANYDTESYAAKILIEKLGIQQERFTNFSEAQKDRLIYGNEFFKLAKATGKEPAEVLKNFKHFLSQRKENSRSHAPASRSSSQKERKNENYPFTPDAGASRLHSPAGAWEREENSTSKRIQLEEQFKQKFDELTKIEELRTRLNQIEKYSFHWFNTLLELEYLLYGENKKNGFNIKFSKVEKIPQSATSFILKNPSRYIPPSIEDIADLSLQLHFGSETKTVLIEAVNVKEFILHARLKSATDIQEMDINRVQSAVVEIKNPAFVLDKLKTEFQQLPCADDDNLQANLTPQIEFILGPPGTGKTTYLAKERIIPLMQKAENLKILVLTPTNKVADVLVNKIMRFAEPKTAQNELIRFGVTGNSEIEKAGLLKEKSFELTHLKKCVLVTTIARFLYDGFSSGLLKDFHWDIIVFDEASMIMLAQMVHVLYQQTHCRFIIGGDPFQIQPLVRAEQWKAENIYTLVGINRFQSIKTVPHHFPITQLTTQYRSIPPLGMLFS